MMLLNGAHPADRMRFTLAHELGHLVMHRFPNEKMEEEANEFASSLLLPEADMREAFTGRRVTLPLLAALKPEWKVAMQALLYRAGKLGLVDANQSRYLWQKISANGWKTREPPELDFAREEPIVLPSIIQAHLGELGYSLPDLSKMLRLHESDIVAMYSAAKPKDEPPRNQRVSLRIIK